MKTEFPKIGTIIKHEYLIKVRSKGFIISTLLGPLIMVAFLGIVAFIGYISQDSTEKKIAILDYTGKIGNQLIAIDSVKYTLTSEKEKLLENQVKDNKIDGFLVIWENFLETGRADLTTSGGGSLGLIGNLDSDLSKILRHQRLLDAGITEGVIKLVNKGADIQTRKLTKEGAQKDYAEVFAILGYVLGFGIYILMFMYGSFVMRSVIEEKANRIVEIIASSARPFEIMFGKVVGVGAVGLTQVLFWVLISPLFFMGAEKVINIIMKPEDLMQGMQMAQAQGSMQMAQAQAMLPKGFEMPHISPWLGVGFIFYFLSGYFIFSSLFAAVGSAVDQESDAQQLMTPVSLLIVIPMLFIPYLMTNPDNTLSIVLSLFPYFSPMLMMVRISATNVPFWQVALSVVLLVACFFFTLWIAAKVYRVGILMYGKKPSFKDIIKWLRVA
ncbi:MAG: transporter permease [Ignavibacteria bacterium]|nr:transporter permease [Ignavibacteria bacterium]